MKWKLGLYSLPTIGIQVYKWYLHWALKSVNVTYIGLFGLLGRSDVEDAEEGTREIYSWQQICKFDLSFHRNMLGAMLYSFNAHSLSFACYLEDC